MPGHGAGQQHRVQRGVVGAVVAVGARPLNVVHGHLAGRQAQAGRDGPAQREHALAVAPDGDLLPVPAGDGAAGRHRGVGQVGPGELGLQGAGHRGGRLLIVPFVDGDHLCGRGQQERLQVPLVGQGRGHLPPGRPGDRPRRHDRGPVRRRHHPEEGAVAHGHHVAGQRRVAEPGQGRRRGGRADDAAVQHAGQDEIVQEPGPPGHLVRDVQPGGAAARDRPPRGRLGRLGVTGLPVQQAGRGGARRAGQRPVGQAGAAGVGGDLAVRHPQRGCPGAQPVRGGGQEQVPGLRARLAQRRAGLLDGAAARGDALIGAGGGGHRGDPDAPQVHVELLGRDLRQRGPNALAVLDLARADRDHAGTAEVEPGGQDGVGGEGGRQRRRGWRGSAHLACSATSLAAFMTAPTILRCAPQRHRLPSSASRTSRSVGVWLPRSSATALTTMPEVQ